jgi:hypothetical protein
MKNKNILWILIGIVLAFGLVFVGCGDGTGDIIGGGNGGSDDGAGDIVGGGNGGSDDGASDIVGGGSSGVELYYWSRNVNTNHTPITVAGGEWTQFVCGENGSTWEYLFNIYKIGSQIPIDNKPYIDVKIEGMGDTIMGSWQYSTSKTKPSN